MLCGKAALAGHDCNCEGRRNLAGGEFGVKPGTAASWPAMKRFLCTASFALVSSFARADSVLAPVGPVGRGDALIMMDALVIMLAIVIPTMIATLVFAWWYRASNTRAVYRPDFTYSGKIELVVWSIPTLTIFFLGGVIWIGSHMLDPFEPLPSKIKPLEIEAVSFDWKWLFI